MSLDKLRAEIDRIDNSLIKLLAERKSVAVSIAAEKAKTGQNIVQPKRFEYMLAQRVESAHEQGLSSTFIKKLWHAIHEESIKTQEDLK